MLPRGVVQADQSHLRPVSAAGANRQRRINEKLTMRISTIPHIYRNVRRWTEILSVLSKYGLADWLSRLNIEMFKNSSERESW